MTPGKIELTNFPSYILYFYFSHEIHENIFMIIIQCVWNIQLKENSFIILVFSSLINARVFVFIGFFLSGLECDDEWQNYFHHSKIYASIKYLLKHQDNNVYR
jgi:hypothetical protein